jgi:imidazolonepropionase
MTQATLLIRHGRVATMTGAQNAPADGPLGLVEDGIVAVAGEQIAYVGPEAQTRLRKAKAKPAPGEGVEIEVAANAVEIDAQGQLVTPGLVEPHSHLLFAGDRADEFSQRLAGATYVEIAQAGGGIVATVKSTRDAKDEDLVLAARERLGRLARAGVTTAEVKSGYALGVEGELRLLKLIREAAKGVPCDVVPTLLALHAVPPEMESRVWVEAVLKELLPRAVSEKLAHGVDAFCEKGAFGTDECRTVLEAGIRAGLVGHLHADQLTNSGGAALAAATGCGSADHLEKTGSVGIAAMAKSGTVAVLLPLAAWSLKDPPAQAPPFLKAGVPVALGGNLNPGTQRMESVSLLLAAGCVLAGMTPAQALYGVTAAAARALLLQESRGKLVRGLRADVVIHGTRDPAHLPYHAAVEHSRLVVWGGKVVLDLRKEPLRCG